MIWNETKECISRDELAELQSKRLVKVVNRVYHNVEYYRKKMQEVGIEPGDIREIEDITKLPYTTKNDLRDTYPFGHCPGSCIEWNDRQGNSGWLYEKRY